MDVKTRRQFRRTLNRIELFYIAVAAVLVGGLAWGYGLYDLVRLNLIIRESVAVNGSITEKFNTYITDNDGDTFPRFHLQYTYIVNGSSYTGTQEVNRDFFNQAAIGNTLLVYYERTQPTVTRIDLAGIIGGRQGLVFIGGAALLIGILVLYLLYQTVFGK